MRPIKFIAGQPSSCVLIALCGVLLAFCPRGALRGGRRITISRETTYLTEPLRPDGYVDYRAALNAMASKGVTPDNNAAVLFWQAVGPSGFRAADVGEYFKLLGVPPPPATGSYFTPVSVYRIKPPPATLPPSGMDPNDPDVQLSYALGRAWSKQEFPAVAAWLQANSKPLQLALQASQRPRFFSPLHGLAIAGLVQSPLSRERDIGYLLAADATLKAGEGQLDGAWQDALACHRFARLVCQGPADLDDTFGMTIDDEAATADCAILASDQLTAEQVRRFAREFGELPPLAPIAEKLETGSRFFTLNALAEMAGSTTSSGMFVNGTQSLLPRWTPDSHLDWEATFRLANSWFDKTVRAAAIERPPERRKAVAALMADYQELSETITAAKFNPLGRPDAAAAELVSKDLLLGTLAGAANAINYEDRNLERRQICRVAFALAAYRVDHGRYPSELSELVPRYIDAVPKDRFSGLDLHFHLEQEGYVLYGCDYNGNDTPLNDPRFDPPREHIGIRMPPRASE